MINFINKEILRKNSLAKFSLKVLREPGFRINGFKNPDLYNMVQIVSWGRAGTTTISFFLKEHGINVPRNKFAEDWHPWKHIRVPPSESLFNKGFRAVYLFSDPGVHVSVAITDMTVHNGCLQVIPGTHHYDVDLDAMAASGECNLSDAQSLVRLADRLYPEKAPHKVISMEMKSGQYFFTRGGLWHGVGPNNDKQNRMGLVARFASPAVEVKQLANEPVPCILVRGRDSYKLNSFHSAPSH